MIKRKKLLLLSTVAVATFAMIFVLHATMHTPSPPISLSTNMPASLTNTDGGDLLQAFGGTGFGTPVGNFTRNQIGNNSRVMRGLRGIGCGMLPDGGSPSTQLADNSDIDSNHATNADDLLHGPDGTGSETSRDDFISILLANNAYPKYDYDFEAIEGRDGLGAGQALENVAPDTSSGSVKDEPLSHVPEPATMLLLGSALVGVAVFARKLRKS